MRRNCDEGAESGTHMTRSFPHRPRQRCATGTAGQTELPLAYRKEGSHAVRTVTASLCARSRRKRIRKRTKMSKCKDRIEQEEEKEVTAAVSDDVGAKQRLLAISGCRRSTIKDIEGNCNRIYVLYKSCHDTSSTSYPVLRYVSAICQEVLIDFANFGTNNRRQLC